MLYKKTQVYYPTGGVIRMPNNIILFIFPLKNNNLIVCSHSEMKIYKNESGKYSYYKTIET